MVDDVDPDDGMEDEENSSGARDGHHEEEPRSPEELIPTPEELEGGEAPRAPRRRREQPEEERRQGFLERFRMRRRRGVGRRRKYVTLDEASAGGSLDDDEPGGAASSGLPARVQPPPATDGQGATAPIPAPATEDDAVENEPVSREMVSRRHEAEEPDEPERETETSADRDDDAPRRVGSVTIRKPRPPVKAPPTGVEERPKTQKEKRIAELYERAKRHGHSMGSLQPVPGKDNKVARCTKCGLRATLVADQDDMSTYVRWGVRGSALEQHCSGRK